MKTGDLTAGAGKLQNSWKKLRERWEEAQLHWHDPVSQQFDEEYMTRLDPYVRSTLEIMRTLNEISSAAKQECDPERHYL